MKLWLRVFVPSVWPHERVQLVVVGEDEGDGHWQECNWCREGPTHSRPTEGDVDQDHTEDEQLEVRAQVPRLQHALQKQQQKFVNFLEDIDPKIEPWGILLLYYNIFHIFLLK